MAQKSIACGHLIALFEDADEPCVECFDAHACSICSELIVKKSERCRAPWGALQHKACRDAQMDARAVKKSPPAAKK